MQTMGNGPIACCHAHGVKCTHTQHQQLVGLLCLDHAQARCMIVIDPHTHKGCQSTSGLCPPAKPEAGGCSC